MLFDNFEYDIGRDDAGAVQAFIARGYAAAKTQQGSDRNVGGYLYTTTRIPGYSGAFPGGGTRVLAMEALPSTTPAPPGFPYGQTDFYLQIGREESPPGAIPAQLWIQYWVYANDVPGQASRFHDRNKFFYPTAAEAPAPPYPSTNLRWLLANGSRGFQPEGDPRLPQNQYLALQAFEADWLDDVEYPTNRTKLFQNLSGKQVTPNAWFLVKMRIDVSGPQGEWHAWVRRADEAQFTKVAEWVGVPGTRFTWPLTAEQRRGHRMMRIPTTVNSLDNWLYFDDLCISSSESDLPTYRSGP